MSDSTSTSISRRRLLEAAGSAAAAAAALGLTGPAAAAQPTTETAPFQATVSGSLTNVTMIPTVPPLLAGTMSLKGTSEALGGEVTMTDTHVGHLGVDGVFKRSTDGRAVFAGPGGDAVFIEWSGVARPSATAGIFDFTGAFTLKGGSGRYAGAVGSGDMRSVVDVSKGTVTQTWEGVIVYPRC
jgi:hypothetical protein